MRILLIATNRHRRLMSRMNAQPVPIGLAYIAGHLDPQRHQLKILDLMFSEDYLADTEQAVREFQPGLVGVSLRNLDNSSYIDPQWALPATRAVIDRVRSVTSAPIVCGGP
ncbi:MAG TPA: cobalamin B12-binding domain-containing protein, partial [Dehalococcoidia bacterium]|nr:cobalamin B12-binding domain-containing protein [Dehalococcoidia bacterium]